MEFPLDSADSRRGDCEGSADRRRTERSACIPVISPSIGISMRFLITSASTFFATRLIQGAGARGIEVTAADSHWSSVGKVSRFATRRLRIPSLSRDPAGYLAAV